MNIIEQAVEHLGGQAVAAKKLGVTPQAVWGWVHNDRPLPPKRAMKIEELAGDGKYTRYTLRGDFFGDAPANDGSATKPLTEALKAQEAVGVRPGSLNKIKSPEEMQRALEARGITVPPEGQVAGEVAEQDLDPDAKRVEPMTELP